MLHPHDIPMANATLGDYLAAHAPEMPGWYYQHAVENRKNTHPLPVLLGPDEAIDAAVRAVTGYVDPTAVSEHVRSILRDWLRDGCFELEGVEGMNDTIIAVGKKANELRIARLAQRDAAAAQWEVDTWFAWRWYYAGQMLERSSIS